MNRRQIQSTLRKLINQLGKTLRGWVRRSQVTMYERLAALIDRMEEDGGRLLRNRANTLLQADMTQQVRVTQAALLSRVIPWIVRNVRRIVSLNRDYYATRNPEAVNVFEDSVSQVLLSLGYDTQTRQVLEGSYLNNLAGNNLVRDVMARVSSAIAGGQSLAQFRSSFRREFVGIGRLGLLERQFALLSRNLFAQVDRTASLTYAENLGLTHAVYSHTIKNNTRKFCRQRANMIYTREEVRSWDRLTWQGKIDGVPAEVQMGGHNCRGNFRWISKELAERLAESRGIEINSYLSV